MRRLIAVLATVAVVFVAGCTPSAEIIESSSVDRIVDELDLSPVVCEDVRAHPRLENTWIVYCNQPGAVAAGPDWALVDAAVTYRDNHTRARSSATAIYQTGDIVRYYRQICDWAGSQLDWTSSCRRPELVAMFPLG